MPDMPAATRLVDESLFTDADGTTLEGAACTACGTTTFPAQNSCPRCGGSTMAHTSLPRTGTLWSFTVQNFEPKTPYRGWPEFEPYGVGYVDLGPVIVETRLTVNDPAALSIGQRVAMTTIPAFEDENGTTVLTFAFGPDAADVVAEEAVA